MPASKKAGFFFVGLAPLFVDGIFCYIKLNGCFYIKIVAGKFAL
jgi:hypothetical protein